MPVFFIGLSIYLVGIVLSPENDIWFAHNLSSDILINKPLWEYWIGFLINKIPFLTYFVTIIIIILFSRHILSKFSFSDESTYLDYSYLVFLTARFLGYKEIDMTYVPNNMQFKLHIKEIFQTRSTERRGVSLKGEQCVNCSVSVVDNYKDSKEVHFFLGDSYNIDLKVLKGNKDLNYKIINSDKKHYKNRTLCSEFQKEVCNSLDKLFEKYEIIHLYPYLSPESVLDITSTVLTRNKGEQKNQLIIYQRDNKDYTFDGENFIKMNV